jgi:hypothetical protein
MTKVFWVLVLLAATLFAGPIKEENDTPALLPDRGLTTYAAFMDLAGPAWLLAAPATFDSVVHYALIGAPPIQPFDPLAEPLSTVPEPRSLALLGFGLAALALLGAWRRRFRLRA